MYLSYAYIFHYFKKSFFLVSIKNTINNYLKLNLKGRNNFLNLLKKLNIDCFSGTLNQKIIISYHIMEGFSLDTFFYNYI